MFEWTTENNIKNPSLVGNDNHSKYVGDSVTDIYDDVTATTALTVRILLIQLKNIYFTQTLCYYITTLKNIEATAEAGGKYTNAKLFQKILILVSDWHHQS